MLTREQKKTIVNKLEKDIREAKAVVFTGFGGMSGSAISELRSNLRKENVGYKVVKLTLLKKALKRAGIDDSILNSEVPTSVSYSKIDEIAPAKILADFAKKNEKLQILAGLMEGRFLAQEQVKALAALPGKQELRGQLASVIAGPLRGLVGVMAGNLRQLLYALNAVRDAKGQS